MGTNIQSPKTNKPVNITVPYRRTTNKLMHSHLVFFYENFVIRCENDESPLKYFYINSKEVKKLKKELKFYITPIKPVKGLSLDTLPKTNEFVFINDKNSAIASLLYHIRNVFVHNRIYVNSNGEIELIDVIPPKKMKKKELEKLWAKGEKRPNPRITMYAKISSFIKLKKILLGIINTQQ